MHDLIQIALLGLGPGAFDGILALGMVLTYRTSGVLNFALGVTGAIGSYATALLAQHVPLGISLCLGALLAAVLGVAIYGSIARIRNKHATLIASAISLGIWLVMQQLLVHISDASIPFPALLPSTIVDVGTWSVSPLFLATLLLGVALLTGISAFLRWTRPGTILRAIEEDREAARLCGVRVAAVLAAVWGGAALLAYLSAACQAQLTFEPNFMTPVLIGALIASTLTGLRSFVAAFAGALVLEMGRVVLKNYHPGFAGHLQTLVLVLLVLTLLFAPRGVVLKSAPRPL